MEGALRLSVGWIGGSGEEGGGRREGEQEVMFLLPVKELKKNVRIRRDSFILGAYSIQKSLPST